MPKVSVVVPVYNVEKYLSKCLDSLINQSFRDIEIICVDDGSPDKSGEIAEEYAKKDSRIVVVHKENAGLGYARNTGMEHAEGEYVTFVDSDDWLTENYISNLVNAAEKYEADTVIGGYSRYSGGKITPMPNITADKVFRDDEVVPEVLGKMAGPLGDGSDVISMGVCRVMFSMEIIRKFNITFPSEREFISEDMIFDIRYYTRAKAVCGSADTGYMYLVNPGSLTQKYNPDRYNKGRVLYEEKKRLFKENENYDENVRFRIEESFLRYSRYAIKSEVKFSKQNGSKQTKKNLAAIISDKTLREMVNSHNNPLCAKIDKIIDYCIKKNKPSLMYYVLKAGYLVK